MSRTSERQMLDEQTRILLAESDLDRHDTGFIELRDSLKGLRDEVGNELKGIRRMLMGLLVSISMASLVLVATILTSR